MLYIKLIEISSNQPTISFQFFSAFIYLLNNIELIKKVYMTCANENSKHEVTKGHFLKEAQQFSQLTPYEIDILFSLIKSFRDDQ